MKRVEQRPGQESVWDYPRPPAVVPSDRRVVVELGGRRIADTRRSLRVLETSHPPTYYIPMADITPGVLRASPKRTVCEYKGAAHYFDVAAGGRVEEAAAWHYPAPEPGYETLRDHVAFYPARMGACFVDGERVAAQAGDFYGGWITEDIVGPFKGGSGTAGW